MPWLPLPLTDPPQPPGLDLARLLIRDPERTVLLRVAGPSMQGAGIDHGDLLVVDRDREAMAGSIVVARFGSQFTLKRLRQERGRRWLEAAHPDYPPIPLEPAADSREDRTKGGGADGDADSDVVGEEVQLWGVAVHVIHPL
ncbi:MAG: S24 family peptidase [Cyanobium sp.]